MTVRFHRLSNSDWSRTTVLGVTYTIKPLEGGWLVLQHRQDSRSFGDVRVVRNTEAEAREYVRALHR